LYSQKREVPLNVENSLTEKSMRKFGITTQLAVAGFLTVSGVASAAGAKKKEAAPAATVAAVAGSCHEGAADAPAAEGVATKEECVAKGETFVWVEAAAAAKTKEAHKPAPAKK
jgi:hypothetical protein